MADPCNAAFFQRYRELEGQVNNLGNTEGRLAQTQELLTKKRGMLAKMRADLAANEKQQKTREARIHSCKTSYFYGTAALQPHLWFSGGVAGKIERQEKKMEADKKVEAFLKSEIPKTLASITPLEQQTAAATGANAQKHSIQAEHDAMFNQCVSTHPSPLLQQLQPAEKQWEEALATELQNIRVLDGLSATTKQSLSLYEAARRHQDEANRHNQEAMRYSEQVKREEAEERRHHHHGGHQPGRGPGRGGHGGGHHPPHNAPDPAAAARRRKNKEDELARKRDRAMKNASCECDRATTKLNSMFAAIPPNMHQRYPQLTARLGNVPMPMLETNNRVDQRFLSFMGSETANLMSEINSASKINRNQHLIMQCQRVAQEQQMLLQALITHVRTGEAETTRQLAENRQRQEVEKARIFSAVEASAMRQQPQRAPGRPQYAPVPPPNAPSYAQPGAPGQGPGLYPDISQPQKGPNMQQLAYEAQNLAISQGTAPPPPYQ